MVRNDKNAVSSHQNEHHKRILNALLREEGNRRCADCLSRGPTWASVNLGVFVCLNCSGIHRSLGVHNSKVRSTSLDTWLPEQVAFVQSMGNVRGNAFWEASLPRDFHRPREADMAPLRVFITDKYVNKRYASREYREPPTIENYATHPFLAKYEAEKGQGATSSNGAVAVAVAAQPAAAAAPAVPPPAPSPAAVPHFDLLSLDDHHVPATTTPVAPLSTTTSAIATSPAPMVAHPAAAAPAPHAPAHAANWDPFSALVDQPARPSSMSSGSTSASMNSAAVPAVVDPFGEMDRAGSRSSMTSSLNSTSQMENSTSGPTLVDPFANFVQATPPANFTSAPLSHAFPPPSQCPMSLPGQNAAIPVQINSSSVAIGPQLTPSNSGRVPMRAPSGSVHSKGSMSHDDILAMFDRTPSQTQSGVGGTQGQSGFGGSGGL